MSPNFLYYIFPLFLLFISLAGIIRNSTIKNEWYTVQYNVGTCERIFLFRWLFFCCYHKCQSLNAILKRDLTSCFGLQQHSAKCEDNLRYSTVHACGKRNIRFGQMLRAWNIKKTNINGNHRNKKQETTSE